MPALHFRSLIFAVRRPFQRHAAAAAHLALMPLAACLIIITLASPPAFPQTSTAAAPAATAADWLPSSPPRPHGSLSSPAQSSDPVRIGSAIEPVSIVSLLGKLALAAGLLFAGLWGWARWTRRGIPTPGAGRGGLIRVRERVSLGSAGHLYLVTFGSRNLLISVAGDNVALLTANAASEMEGMDIPAMEGMDTPAFSVAPQDITATGASPAASPPWVSPSPPASDKARGLFREDSRRAADWERKRDALVRALQDSVES